ncbi:ChrR family anti-sigma-E factor [Thalassotalea crassostreae]|uniref:ChrR family anti-sigma-E factor n=1 Tax=Thalassotalea crassostreae TaxID=1763536 RepID=UPI000838AAEA|nr:ChrR family anti-sigma-E factor [Thalassotalea crassostreae]
MIKHHPSIELLTAFSVGDLPASLSAAVAMHNDFCPTCKQKSAQLNERNAEQLFEAGEEQLNEKDFDAASINIDELIASITSNDDIDVSEPNIAKTINIKGKEYRLPRAIMNMPMSNPTSFGQLTRARMDLGEGEIHSSLLEIAPGGSVPEHTHKGYEVTLLLEGHFNDELGDYVPGDFIMLDGEHTHNPMTKDGCLCFTVASDALHFTKGINKLLNPIASFIY